MRERLGERAQSRPTPKAACVVGLLVGGHQLVVADVDRGHQAAGVDDAAGKGAADAAALVRIDAAFAAVERNRGDDRTDAAACGPAVFIICS